MTALCGTGARLGLRPVVRFFERPNIILKVDFASTTKDDRVFVKVDK